MNQPSDEALTRLLRFLVKTSVPRILAEMEQEKVGDLNEHNQQNEHQSG